MKLQGLPDVCVLVHVWAVLVGGRGDGAVEESGLGVCIHLCVFVLVLTVCSVLVLGGTGFIGRTFVKMLVCVM